MVSMSCKSEGLVNVFRWSGDQTAGASRVKRWPCEKFLNLFSGRLNYNQLNLLRKCRRLVSDQRQKRTTAPNLPGEVSTLVRA